MKFKPMVASLFALGLISSPVLAANEAKEQTKHTKHHERHARHHHRHHAEHRVAGEFAAQEHFISTNSARSPVAAFDWVNRFHFSGLINVDGKYSTRAPLGTAPGFRVNKDSSDINVNNANLFVDVDVNRLLTAHIGVAYVADSVNLLDWDVNTNFAGTAFTDAVRGDKGGVFANGRLSVDEAYITIRDFAQSPFFFRAGKMYVPFGDNPDVYPITYSFTQLLSQTRGTAVQLGWVGNRGLYASAYLLSGAESSFKLARRQTAVVFTGLGAPDDYAQSFTEVNNWGAQAGYCGGYDDVHYRLSASYIKDIRDVWFLAGINDLVKYSFIRNDGRGGMGYRFHQVGGGALHGDLTYGPVYFSANYVSALGDLLDGRGRARQENRRHHHDNDTRIAAADINGTYNTSFLGYNSSFNLSYQRSWDSAPVLPEWRILASVGACILPWTTLTLEYHYDRDFDRSRHGLDHFISDHDRQENDNDNDGHHHHHHGHERSSNTAALRLGVVF